eukprot:scaffold3367_cov52-Phaeocystis_antarctica.AAC.5
MFKCRDSPNTATKLLSTGPRGGLLFSVSFWLLQDHRLAITSTDPHVPWLALRAGSCRSSSCDASSSTSRVLYYPLVELSARALQETRAQHGDTVRKSTQV